MKKNLFISCLFMMFIGLASAFAAKPTAAQIEQAAAVRKAMAESQDYTLYINRGANNTRGGTISISAIVRIKGSEVYSSLPYWGDARNTAFSSSDAAMRFTANITNYEVTEGKKNKTIVTLSAEVPGGQTYKLRFEIFYNGRVDLATSGSNVQPMSYSGVIGASTQGDTEQR